MLLFCVSSAASRFSFVCSDNRGFCNADTTLYVPVTADVGALCVTNGSLPLQQQAWWHQHDHDLFALFCCGACVRTYPHQYRSLGDGTQIDPSYAVNEDQLRRYRNELSNHDAMVSRTRVTLRNDRQSIPILQKKKTEATGADTYGVVTNAAAAYL